MRKRNFPNWLDAFIEYSSELEAPIRMYFWTGVSTLAGTLRRKVWVGGHHFKWYPNFYIVFVAPPGIISKSTTSGIGMNLLRKVEGVHFGPAVVTWQALVSMFADSKELIDTQYGEEIYESCLTIDSSELGNLLDPTDRAMVDMLITLWDGKSFEKGTKYEGLERIENPWLNAICCTTPGWLKDNMPESVIAGGFTSRCLFIYGNAKRHFNALPWENENPEIRDIERRLIEDLQYINDNLKGQFTLDKPAKEFAKAWYEKFWEVNGVHSDERHKAHIARLQTYQFKTAMILSAAQRDDLRLTREILETATAMVMDTAGDLPKIFSNVGKSELSQHVERLLRFVEAKGEVEYTLAYKVMHQFFPSVSKFEDAVLGLVMSGQIQQVNQAGKMLMRFVRQ